MTNPAERSQAEPQRNTQDDSHDEPLDEYAHLDAETVVEDAVQLFQTGSEPPPVLNPDDPPPERADAMD
jgi:hypothetical protein